MERTLPVAPLQSLHTVTFGLPCNPRRRLFAKSGGAKASASGQGLGVRPQPRAPGVSVADRRFLRLMA